MQKYKFVRYLPEGRDKRLRPLEPTEASIEALFGWLLAHLATLDGIDGGDRLQRFLAATDTIAAIQPRIADALLSTHAVRQPERTFSLFTWLNNGGIVMDWLISGMQDADADAERITTGVASIAEMADWLKLSRTHLARKLRRSRSAGQHRLAGPARQLGDVGLEGFSRGVHDGAGGEAGDRRRRRSRRALG